MRTVAIVGVGLIGGSFGLALRKAGFNGDILGVSSPRSIGAAWEMRAISYGATLEQAAEKADLIFLSQPVSGILRTLDDLEPLLIRKRTLVTDVGSTKVQILNRARKRLRDAIFIGGHPMAGKETRGVESADPDLFRGRPWVFTHSYDHPVELELYSYLEKFGARRVLMDAETHDRAVAWGSHLPQILSTVLSSVLARQAPEAAQIAGPGLIDMTRLAMSSYDLWSDIIETNRDEIVRAMGAFALQLGVAKEDFEKAFSEGAEFARQLRGVKE